VNDAFGALIEVGYLNGGVSVRVLHGSGGNCRAQRSSNDELH